MKHLVLSRNVINEDEVEPWLIASFGQRYQDLLPWLTSTVRRWIIKNAPAVASNIDTKQELPAWLQKALDANDELVSLSLDDALYNRIAPVLDYIENLVAQKPDVKLNSVGFDVAEARSIKWHADLAKKVVTIKDEDGASVVTTYPDGYTWRYVVGKLALNREGDLMGHCVGSYHSVAIRGGVSIFSLRDGDNEPHVTIEVVRASNSIQQIKGKANQEVLPKYLPYVLDFLKSRNWDYVRFDGARSIQPDYLSWLADKQVAWFENSTYRLVPDVQYPTFNGERRLTVFSNGAKVAHVNVSRDSTRIDMQPVLPALLVPLLVEKRLLSVNVWELLPQTAWTGAHKTWARPVNDAAKAFCLGLVGLDEVSVCLLSDTCCLVHEANKKVTVFVDRFTAVEADVKTALLDLGVDALPIEVRTYLAPGVAESSIQSLLQSWWAKHVIGVKIKGGTDIELLNGLLSAMKQPSVEQIKAAYLKLKNRDSITDADLKALGFVTGGRAINAIGIALLASLPIKNQRPFREYVYGKPNALTCLLDVVSAPQHIMPALKSYGVPDAVIDKTVQLLRNELLRLIPSKDELADMDLDAGIKVRVAQSMAYALAHKTNKARSKDIWGHV
jgi:hypothetical protein